MDKKLSSSKKHVDESKHRRTEKNLLQVGMKREHNLLSKVKEALNCEIKNCSA